MVSYDWANGGSVSVFFRHGIISGLWRGGVSAILGNGCAIQGQNCVARLKGRVL